LVEFDEDLSGELSLHDVYENDKEENERKIRNKKQQEYAQRPGVKERIKQQIVDRAVAKRIEKINKNELSICKKICLKYAVKKPTNNSRYGSGQKRCQMCEIFISIEGTKNEEGLFCKCCHYRVRGKPRNLKYKEKLRVKVESDAQKNESQKFQDTADSRIDVTNDIEASNYVQEHKFLSNIEPDTLEQDENDVDESRIDTNKDYRNIGDDSSEEESTPNYNKIDAPMKTFYELKDFLDKIHLQSNYQLVMLKELIEYGVLNKGEIAESLAYFNNKDTTDINVVKSYFNVPVYDVLLKHKFVIKIDKNSSIQYYSLHVDLNQMQTIDLINYLSDEIIKYNEEHNIPDNEFPDSDNMNNFNWNDEFKKITQGRN